MRATDWVLPSWVPTLGRGVTFFGWDCWRAVGEAGGVCGGAGLLCWGRAERGGRERDCSRDSLVSAYHLNRSPIQSQVNAAALLILHPSAALHLGWPDRGESQPAHGLSQGQLDFLGAKPRKSSYGHCWCLFRKSFEAAQDSTATDPPMYAKELFGAPPAATAWLHNRARVVEAGLKIGCKEQGTCTQGSVWEKKLRNSSGHRTGSCIRKCSGSICGWYEQITCIGLLAGVIPHLGARPQC